jgi:hypothetical protein
MKSRHMSAMHTTTYRRTWRGLPWLAAFLLLWVAATAFAQDAIDPPGRVGHLSYRAGGVVFAPHGEDEWTELPQNRPLTSGDRLWTDRGARAEMHVGSATLHIAGESHVGVSTLDDSAMQLILQQGSLSARVRDLQQGENFEIGTPNLAFRALQPGEYRLDVEPDGQTRVTVHSGTAAVFGEGGESVNLGAGQQATFAGRYLARVQGGTYRQDDFGQWAAERNRAEDQSVSARYVPRTVVGYAQLDQHGTWDAHPQYGSVWYPRITVQDWAPYRHGHWTHVQPWGWTWVDDAPWGFAPFHYGRWTQIGPRWAWVPGQLAARPVYSPALVVFMGNGGSSVSISSGAPSVGWYPLAPGEAWWPVYRTSPRYVTYVNYNINVYNQPRNAWQHHWWRQRQYAVMSVSDEDFRRGRPVYRHWRPVQPHVVNQWQAGWVPSRPEGRQWREYGQARPRLQATPPTVLPGLPVRVGGRDRDRDERERDWRNRDRDNDRDGVRGRDERDGRGRDQARDRDRDGRRDNDRDGVRDRDSERGGRDGREGRIREQAVQPPLVREQQRAVREQDRLQRDADRTAREQVRDAEQARREQDLRHQRERVLREQQESARQQEQVARERAEQQRQRAERDAAAQRQNERAQREAAVVRQQEREAARQRQDQAARDQHEQRQRAWQQQQQREAELSARQEQREQRQQQREAMQEQRQQQREAAQEQRQQERGNRGGERAVERGGDHRGQGQGQGQGRWQREANDGPGQGQGRGQRG